MSVHISFEEFRIRRRERYESLFTPPALFAAGLLAIGALLLTPSALLRAVQFLGAWFLCWLAGKKNHPLMTMLVILGIVALNLAVPYGRVLLAFGIFRITSGALLTGLERAVTLEGLLMLSRLSIQRGLTIPGGFGELLGESFRFFVLITESRKRITRKNFMDDIDALLMELSEDPPETAPGPLPSARIGAPGLIILVSLVILFWIPPVLGFLR